MRYLALLGISLCMSCASQPLRENAAEKSVPLHQSACQVITHDLTNRPNRTIQDSPHFKNEDPEDDFKDLDSSLMHVPTEYELTLDFGGKNGSQINLVADTGSANIIVQHAMCSGCSGTTYLPGADIVPNGYSFPVTFGSGSGNVSEYEDLVGFTCGVPVPYTFGVLSSNVNLPNILGLAYEKVSQPAQKPLPPFFDTLVKSNQVANLFSMTLCGQGAKSQIIFGDNNHGVDLNKLAFAPIVEETYFVLPFKSLRIKGQTKVLGTFPEIKGSNIRTILDSGTTINLIPPAMFSALLPEMLKIKSGLPQAFFTTTEPSALEYAVALSDETISLFPVVQVEVGSVDGGTFWLDISPNIYLKRLNAHKRIFGFRPWSGVPAYMLGQVLMENYYVVFDRANKRVGFGPLTGLCKN